MVKLVAMFSKPEDPAAFDRAYFEEHLPLNAKTPGLRRTEVTRVTGALRGESPWYIVTEMYYDDAASLQAAADDHAVRAVALTGAGRGFCVGQDLRELRDAYNAGESPDFPALLERHYAPVIRLLAGMAKPTVAVVNGVAPAEAGRALQGAGDRAARRLGGRRRGAAHRPGQPRPPD